MYSSVATKTSKHATNKFIPKHVNYPSLPWYEQDSLMAYIDELK